MVAVASGCHLVFPIELDDSHDEDRDGFDNDEDNCVGVYNPGQEDLGELADNDPADGIGDACDPDLNGPDDRIVGLYLFNDPDSDALEWTPVGEAWTFGPGYVELAGTEGELDGPSLGTTPVEMTVEASFEILDDPEPVGLIVGVLSDDTTPNRGWIENGYLPMRYLVVQDGSTSATDMADVVEVLPTRLLVQLSRKPDCGSCFSTHLRVSIPRTALDRNMSGTNAPRGDRFGVFAHGARVRVHHVVVYAGG